MTEIGEWGVAGLGQDASSGGNICKLCERGAVKKPAFLFYFVQMIAPFLLATG